MPLTRGILEAYKLKNPVKYAQKFGNKSIDEILGNLPPEPQVEESNIKVEISTADEITPDFTEAPRRRGRPRTNG